MESKEVVKKLEKLSKAFGPSGYEGEVVEIVKNMVPDSCEIMDTKSGSVLAFLKGSKKGKVLISAHIDEIGLMISKREGEYARIVPIGGVDPKILPSQKLKVRTSYGYEYAIVGMLAPHLQKGERKNVSFDSLFVDLSCAPHAQVGDPAVITSPCVSSDEFFSGKALDNRASVVALVTALEILSNVKEHPDVYALFSSGEEIGALGALTGAFAVEPDVAVAVDATFADDDSPNAPNVKLSKGPAVAKGVEISSQVVGLIVKVAEEYGVNYQIEPIPGRTGTDADMIQIARKGVPVALISIAQLHMHTPVEVVSIKDVWETSRLLASFITEWGENHAS